MASRQEVRRKRPASRLYLVTQAVDDAGALARALEPALAAADVAAVLLRLPAGGEQERIDFVKTVAPTVQRREAALLLDEPGLVARAGGDGVHFTGCDALKADIAQVKPEHIAGAGGLDSRHDAMLAGEAGADYVMFGEPDLSGRRLAFAAVAERVAWWSELFEVPCVGFATTEEEVAILAAAGADFVALCDLVWKDTRDSAAAVASAAGRLRSLELV